MRIELTEVLRCPRCTATAGLVAFIDDADGSRVLEGWLGCPFCEARFPIRAGTVDLTGAGGRRPHPADRDRSIAEAWREGADSAERALALAALLGLQEQTGGFVLLDEALCTLAEPLARLARGREIVALVPSHRGPPEPESVAEPGSESATTNLVLVDPGAALPLLTGRLSGIALYAPDAERLEAAIRALRATARLVVLEPDALVERVARATALRVLASDDTALVAVREVTSG
jgi:uncharacterized protein YbaR (Trm112 family)